PGWSDIRSTHLLPLSAPSSSSLLRLSERDTEEPRALRDPASRVGPAVPESSWMPAISARRDERPATYGPTAAATSGWLEEMLHGVLIPDASSGVYTWREGCTRGEAPAIGRG